MAKSASTTDAFCWFFGKSQPEVGPPGGGLRTRRTRRRIHLRRVHAVEPPYLRTGTAETGASQGREVNGSQSSAYAETSDGYGTLIAGNPGYLRYNHEVHTRHG